MLRHILRATLKQRGRGIFFLVGLLALSTGLSTYVSASQNATLRVNASLDQHWRGAYDLLVRHPDAVQATEKLYGIVESNYLSAGESGISVTQWKTIQQLEGVEVAAPVATIGYLRDASGRVNLNVPNPREQTFYRITTTITSTNGYRETAFLNATDYVLLQPVEATTTTTTTVGNRPSREALKQVVLSTADHSMMTSKQIRFSFRTLPPLWTLVTGIDPASEKALTGLDTAVIEGRYLADNDGIATEKVPNPDKTTYTNDEEGTRQWLEDSGNYAMNPDGPNIPVLIAASAYMSLPLTVWIDGLEMLSGEEIETIQRESPLKAIESFDRSTHTNEPESGFMREGLDAMQLTSVSSIAHGGVDLGAQFRPLHSLAVSASITSTGLMLQTSARYGSFDAVGMENAYRPGAIEYEPNQAPFNAEGVLSLAAVPKDDAQTIITGTGEVAFRSLPLFPPAMAAPTEDSGDDNYRTPFTFHEVGTYDLNSLPDYVRNPDPLTYVPLGIYTPPLVQLVKDADGNPLPQGPVTLGPTLNPASFIPGPPLALTNIAAARFFRGEDCIDAIRVRVEGINRYTPENIAKVESVAAEIIRTTGLHVDIVAGSSPQKVLVYIPGSPDGTVPPLGYVEEPWTTLGAAASIEQGIDRASVLMLGATGIAGLLYLVSQSLLSTLSRRKELALLQAVGWRRRHVAALVVGEASILGVLGGVCASVLAVVVAWGLGLAAPPEQAAGVGVVVFALYVAASLGPALWVTNQPVAELLQRGEVALPTAGRISKDATHVVASGGARTKLHRRSWLGLRIGSTGVWGLARFAWRNLSRRRVRALLAAGGIAIATALLTLMGAALVALGGTLRVTLLGQFVGLQVQPYHYIMVGSAIVVSVLSVADHLAVGVLERRHELALLQAVGWRAGAVRLSLLLEGVWLGLVGGAMGALVAAGAGLASGSESIAGAWWVVPASLGAMMVLCSLSALYAIALTPRHALVRAMQQ